MIPNDLNDWDYELIKKLVDSGMFETERFDFKLNIPHKNDKDGRFKLENSVCAFANTEGGFLVFGVDDNRTTTSGQRIIGVDQTRDFPREVGDKLVNIEPVPFYEFKNPPITILNSRNYVHVIKIPQSAERPHRTSKGEFYYRTNKGNSLMSYQRIKESFLNEEQRRQKLRLLFIELLSNKEQASLMIMPEEKIKESYSLITLDAEILQTLLVETYPQIISNEELIRLLISIRGTIKIINNKMRVFYSEVAFPRSDLKDIVLKHNLFVNQNIRNVLPLLNRSLEILTEKYGLNNPFTLEVK